MYSYVRYKKVITSKVGPVSLENGEMTNNELEMAEALTDYLAFVFTVEDTYEIQDIIPAQSNLILLSDCYFTEYAVNKALVMIKVNKTPGPDYIALRVLKEAKYQISKLLTILFNKSLNSGRVQDILKLANFTPIQKKVDKALPNNYKRISFTSVVCKLMETIIRDK